MGVFLCDLVLAELVVFVSFEGLDLVVVFDFVCVWVNFVL